MVLGLPRDLDLPDSYQSASQLPNRQKAKNIYNYFPKTGNNDAMHRRTIAKGTRPMLHGAGGLIGIVTVTFMMSHIACLSDARRTDLQSPGPQIVTNCPRHT